jgi:hypothetical protein
MRGKSKTALLATQAALAQDGMNSRGLFLANPTVAPHHMNDPWLAARAANHAMVAFLTGLVSMHFNTTAFAPKRGMFSAGSEVTRPDWPV